MPIGYVGGKYAKSKFLYHNCPDKNSYNTLVLNCSGIGWLYLREDFSHCKRIIFNDINPYLINLLKAFSTPELFMESFKSYMEQGHELHILEDETLVEAKDRFKSLYYKWREELRLPTSLEEIDYDSAVKFAFLLSHSFAGRHPLTSGFQFRDGNPKYPNFMKILNILKNRKYADLLRKVKFESLDLVDCIEKHDSEDTFFYIDPPYYLNEADYNVDNDIFGKIGHIRLAEAVRAVKGKIMISYYNFPYLKQFYPDNQFYKISEDFHKPSCNFKDKVSSEKELLIMNYKPTAIQSKFSDNCNFSIDSYFKIAEQVAPKERKRTKRSYSNQFKNIISRLIKLGVKKSLLMGIFGIGSYTTLKRWERNYSLLGNKILLAA